MASVGSEESPARNISSSMLKTDFELCFQVTQGCVVINANNKVTNGVSGMIDMKNRLWAVLSSHQGCITHDQY